MLPTDQTTERQATPLGPQAATVAEIGPEPAHVARFMCSRERFVGATARITFRAVQSIGPDRC